MRNRQPFSETLTWKDPSAYFETRIDWMLVGLSILLVFSGLFAIFSSEVVSFHVTDHFLRQLCALIIGEVLALGLVIVPYQVFASYSKASLVVACLSLVFVLFSGKVFRGTRGWFELGPLRFQASELARPLFVLSYAAYLDQRIQWRDFRSLLVPVFLAGLPVGLLLLQPDLSGALVYAPLVVGMLYLAGARLLHLVSVAIFVLITMTIPLVSTYLEIGAEKGTLLPWQTFFLPMFSGGLTTLFVLSGISLFLAVMTWLLKNFKVPMPRVFLLSAIGIVILGVASGAFLQKHIKHYQRERLVTFLSPSIDPLGSGYQVRQSRIAIGSGRVLGKGLRSDTQVRLGFLPAYHTDFIFSVIAEQFGFLGAVVVVGFYFLMVWRAFDIAANARDKFGSLLAGGLAIMFGFYGFFNIGMTLGFTPVMGIPLPLVSYGGSGLVSHLFAVGLLLSVHRHRYIL